MCHCAAVTSAGVTCIWSNSARVNKCKIKIIKSTLSVGCNTDALSNGMMYDVIELNSESVGSMLFVPSCILCVSTVALRFNSVVLCVCVCVYFQKILIKVSLYCWLFFFLAPPPIHSVPLCIIFSSSEYERRLYIFMWTAEWLDAALMLGRYRKNRAYLWILWKFYETRGKIWTLLFVVLLGLERKHRKYGNKWQWQKIEIVCVRQAGQRKIY